MFYKQTQHVLAALISYKREYLCSLLNRCAFRHTPVCGVCMLVCCVCSVCVLVWCCRVIMVIHKLIFGGTSVHRKWIRLNQDCNNQLFQPITDASVLSLPVCSNMFISKPCIDNTSTIHWRYINDTATIHWLGDGTKFVHKCSR